MATPPPEAPPVLKEEKTQLPPSPTALDVAPTSATADVKMAGMDTPAENNTACCISPQSPAPGVDASATPAPAHDTPAEPTVTDQKRSEAATPAQSQAPEPVIPAEKVEEDKATPKEPAPTPAHATARSSDGAHDIEMQLDGPSDAPAAQPLKTELPHHPTTEPATPALPPLRTDYEMKDAPIAPPSPSKASRERSEDRAEEPAAKRTKVTSENGAPAIKLQEAPKPAAENTRSIQSGVTKLQHKFLMKCVSSLKRMHDSRFYREPVDPAKLNIPNYTQVITRPMDLSTIESKLKENLYTSPQAFEEDFALMVNNSMTFNGPDHLVTMEGVKLKKTLDKQMLSLPKADEVEEKKPKKSSDKTSAPKREPRTSLGSQTVKAASPQSAPTTFALGPEGLPTIRRDSFNPDGRPKRSIHPPKRDLPYSTKPKKKKYLWELRFCQEVLDELHKPKYQLIALAFYYPVDPVALNIPTYHNVIKKPMDLMTIQSKLKTGQYENAKEFELDIRLMFKNCWRFNLKGDPTYLAGESLSDVFDKKWKELPAFVEKHDPPHEQEADSDEEESEEDAEESENEDNEKLSLLQKQIAEMSRQVEMITQRKKKTPPAKKASKPKSGKKELKKSGSTSGKKDKKSSSSGKGFKDKTRFVSYHEKQIISNGISSLPDKKMHEALGIIQSNVPALKGTQEAEIELDIDELPNPVLLLLLDYVKKNVPNIMDDEDNAPTAGYAAPKPKKNKPMSSNEQEARINTLQSNLSRFSDGGAPMPSVEHNESSEDESDEDSEESEEE
ncbi:hypothetical protein N7454_000819 [Penicillium verhagenii]|nr:hypothetical protein N7454_000819 [Penicillium verhagenii]